MTKIVGGKVRRRAWVFEGKRREIWGYTIMIDGKQVRRQGFTCKPDAQEALDQFKESIRNPVEPAREAAPLFSEYAAKWLALIKTNIAPTTWKSYDTLHRLYVKPAFGALPLSAITRAMVKEFVAARRAAGLSKNTVRLIRTTLGLILSEAVDDELIPLNPAAGLNRGRKAPDSQSRTEKVESIKPMSFAQLDTFLTAVARHAPHAATMFLTLADAGLRPGECLALKWPDLDLADGTLRVERAVSDGKVKGRRRGRRGGST